MYAAKLPVRGSPRLEKPTFPATMTCPRKL